MFDLVPTIEAHAQEHPLSSKRKPLYAPAGSTVAQIVAAADLDPRHGLPIVILKRGLQATVLPVDAWGRVKPKPGTQVLIHYEVQDPVSGALLASLVSAAAPTIAGSLFGLTAGTLGFSLATAAITVVGGLLVNALIPPPPQARPGTQDPAQNVITGTQNRANPYGAIPKVLGRHRMFPVRGAKGYTVTTDEGEIEFRGRFIVGWGPVCISDLRIGTTPVTDFEDVELEFLNIDQTETLARQPALASITKAWRTGTHAMTLYPDDVAEDGYAVELVEWTPVVRRTRPGTESADVDITFPQGLFSQDLDEPSKRETRSHTFNFRFRAVGDVDWTSGGSMVVESKQNSQFRKTHKITFPTPDEYDIEVVQASGNNPDSHHFDTSVLSAIRSFRPGGLPSHDGVAEIAIRVRATDQLNGQIDTLNCIGHQMCRTWNGSAWTAPVVTRHPAWILANWLQGVHMKRTVADARIDLAELRAWAVDEPHWTCDLVVEGQTRVREVCDLICPAGRAKFALTDLKYSVIREKPSEPIRQLITPRNSWGFKGRIVYPKTIHALRCVVKSERKQWQEDEVTVYNDGFDASSATEFETIRFPGVVLTDDDTDQSNVYRLGRYHLADALLRYEQMSVNMDFEHLQVQRGDPVLVVHDVPSIGLGTARITSVSRNGSGLNLIRLDDTFPGASGNHRVVVRTKYGDPVEFTAAPSATGDTSSWVYVSGTVDALDLNEGDLVTLQKTTEGRFEALVTNIRRGQNDTAVVTFVPRAVAVTTADTGTIPAYDPEVSELPPNPETQIPASPEVLGAVSSENTAIIDPSGNARPRILVRLAGRREVRQTASQVQLRYRPVGEQTFQVSERSPVGTLSLYTGPLEEGVAYEVDVSSLNRFERRSAWVSATASLVATSSPGKTPAKPGGVAASGRFQSNVVSWQAVVAYTDGTGIVGPVTYRVYRSLVNDPATGQLVHTTLDLSYADSGLADNTLYFYWVTAVSLAGEESAKSTVASATTDFISAAQMVADIRTEIGAARIDVVSTLPSGAGYNAGDFVFLTTDKKLYQFDGTTWSLAVTAAEAVDITGELATNQIALNAVTNALLANDAVQTENIANLAINADKIAANAITTAKIAADAVTAGELAANAVAAINIQTNAITSTKISDNAISSPKITAGAITAGKISTGAVTAGTIAAGAVQAGTIAAGAVTAGTIATNAVTAGTIAAGSITTAKIAAGAVTATNIAAQTITTNQIQAGGVHANRIQAGTITSDQIVAGGITGDRIQANSLTAGQIAANAITASELSTNSVISGKIAAGAVSADKIAVTTLAAIVANLGSVTAGSINTVTGGIGLQVNIPGKPSSVYIYQNSSTTYAAYFENVFTPPSATFAEAGTIKVRSNSGYTIEVDNYGDYVGEQACAFMQNSQDIGSGPRGGAVYLGRNMANGNYGVQVLRGGYYDTSGDGYGPFTGSHECIIAKGQSIEPGDIVVAKRAAVTGISDSLVEVEMSSEANQRTPFGVFTRFKDSWTSVAALIDREKTWKSLAPLERTPSGRKSRRKREVKFHTKPEQFQDDFDLLAVNGVGEGGVNVCGENGDIQPGDLIITSSFPGKGMRQEDDVIRPNTVAKAVGHATFRRKGQTKLVACVYLCS